MKIKYRLTFYFGLLLCLNALAQTDCSVSDIGKKWSEATKEIKTLNGNLSLALKAQKLGPYTFYDLFGFRYKSEASDKYLTAMREQVKRDGVSSKFIELKTCLVKLKQEEELQKLFQMSSETLKLREELLQSDEKLNYLRVAESLSEGNIPELKKEISEDRKKSELEKEELQRDLIDSVKVGEGTELYSQDVYKFKKNLTKIKIDLIDKSLTYNSNLEEKLTYFEDKTQILDLISSQNNDLDKNIENNFSAIETLWLDISGRNLGELLAAKVRYDFPSVPSLPSKLVSITGEQKSHVLEALTELKNLRHETIQDLGLKKEKELRLLNDLILQTNNVRSRLFKKLPLSFKVKRIFSFEGLRAIKNEVLTSPYRLLSFFLSKYYYVRDKLYDSEAGIEDLVRDVLSLLFLVAGLFLLHSMFGRCINWVNSKQNVIVRKYANSSIVKMLSNFWNKVKDNAINIFWLLTLQYMSQLEAFKDYVLVIELVKVFFAVRILKSLVILFLSFVSLVDYRNFVAFKKKATLTASTFGNIFLAYNLSLIIIQAAIGEVFLYSIIKTLIVIYTVWLVVKASAVWEEEFKKYIESRFSGLIVQRLNAFLSYLPSYVRTLATFVAIIILSIFDFLIKVTEDFEVSKKISANLFKKQIESVEADENAEKSIPEDYKERFCTKSLAGSDEKNYVSFDEKLEQKVICEIDEWLEEKSDEHSLVVYGDKGIGKTTFLKHIGEKYRAGNDELEVIYAKMPAKILRKEDLQKFVLRTLTKKDDIEARNIGDIGHLVEQRTILIIDETQNLFLSQIGGFEAYYFLTEMLSTINKNIFWVMSFNKYSWLYLDRAFGRTQFFRNVFELKGWNDNNIKELVMKRHSDSDYSLSYDRLINATRSQDEIDKYASIEAKFFKLLWELSRGNPRAALSLWISALSRKGSKAFSVNIPKDPGLVGIERCSDDLLFVIANVLKHENLSLNELESCTKLPRGIVRNALKVALEKGYLYKDTRGRFVIDINLQHSLVRYLRVKNFIYGN